MTSDAGEVEIKTLANGTPVVRVEKPGFATTAETLEVRSAPPAEHTIRLTVGTGNDYCAGKQHSAADRPAGVLLDHADRFPADSGASGIAAGQARAQDLVNSQPGWLYEGNAAPHPRGSEYQTQFVVDGIPR